jgi:hypothetical protein
MTPAATAAERNNRIRHRYTSKLEWLNVNDLQTEPGVTQREFDPNFAKKLARDFDPDLIGYPLVVRVGIRLVVIDGQHRIAAAREVLGDNQKVQCELVEGITVQRAAQLFRGRNSRRSVTPLANFLVGITAKDPIVLAVNDAITRNGYHVAAGASGHNVVSAISAVLRIYRLQNNAELVSDVLSVIRTAWGDESSNCHGDFMIGMALVLHRYPELDKGQLIERLKKLSGAMRVLASARGLKEGLGGSIMINTARSLIAIYNSGRRNTTLKLADWGTSEAAHA